MFECDKIDVIYQIHITETLIKEARAKVVSILSAFRKFESKRFLHRQFCGANKIIDFLIHWYI